MLLSLWIGKIGQIARINAPAGGGNSPDFVQIPCWAWIWFRCPERGLCIELFFKLFSCSFLFLCSLMNVSLRSLINFLLFNYFLTFVDEIIRIFFYFFCDIFCCLFCYAILGYLSFMSSIRYFFNFFFMKQC